MTPNPDHPQDPPSTPHAAQVERYQGLAIIDAAGTHCQPGCLLVQLPPTNQNNRDDPPSRLATILALGASAEVDSHPLAVTATKVDRPRAVLIPGLVNAHTHLDLTHLGPIHHDPGVGFVAWVDQIRGGRRTEPSEIAASVRLGIEKSLAGGTVAVGDIAGAVDREMTTVPFGTLAASPMLGVSFAEFFGIGKSEAASCSQVRQFAQAKGNLGRSGATASASVRLGLQPHAPNTVGPALYRHTVRVAQDAGMPLSTHLAETPEERAFITEGIGPHRDFLERLGLWEDSILEWAGQSLSPIAHLAEVLGLSPMLVAHANDASDDDIAILAQTNTSVAYCPHASAYFDAAAHFGPHRYREMLAAGVNVALGTDSIVNLPADQAASRMSILDEMRFLFERDAADPLDLLKMGTTNGAAALGLDPVWFSFREGGRLAGLVAVEVELETGSPLARILSSSAPPELLLAPAAI